MSSIHDRISYAISVSGRKKKDIAAEMCISPQLLSQFCTGTAAVIDRNIVRLAEVLQVDYHWLRTGEGEMKPEKTADEKLYTLVNEALIDKPDNFKRLILEAFSDLDDDGWRYAWYLIQQLRGNRDP